MPTECTPARRYDAIDRELKGEVTSALIGKLPVALYIVDESPGTTPQPRTLGSRSRAADVRDDR